MSLRFPTPSTVVFRSKSLNSPHFRGEELCSTSLRREYIHTLFRIFLQGSFVSSPFIYLIIYFFHYRPMDIYLIFLYCNPILLFSCSNSSRFGQQEFFQLACVPLTDLNCFFVFCFSASLFSSAKRSFRLILYILCPSLEAAISLRGPGCCCCFFFSF